MTPPALSTYKDLRSLGLRVDLVAAELLQPVRSSASPNAWAQVSGQFASSVRRMAT